MSTLKFAHRAQHVNVAKKADAPPVKEFEKVDRDKAIEAAESGDAHVRVKFKNRWRTPNGATGTDVGWAYIRPGDEEIKDRLATDRTFRGRSPSPIFGSGGGSFTYYVRRSGDGERPDDFERERWSKRNSVTG